MCDTITQYKLDIGLGGPSFQTIISHNTQVNINLLHISFKTESLQQDVCTYRLHTTHPGSPYNAQATILEVQLIPVQLLMSQPHGQLYYTASDHNLMISLVPRPPHPRICRLQY